MAMDTGKIGRRSLLAAAGLWAARPIVANAATAKPKVAITTPRGVIVVQMETRRAPITANNFLRYVDGGLYDGGNFYRAMRAPDDPQNGTIQGQLPGGVRRFPPIAHESTEKTGMKHGLGSISLARFTPGTATADFFICLGPMPYLDAHPGEPGDNQGYAVFGHVVAGMDVVRKIHALPTGGKAAFPELKGQILTHPIPIVSMKRTA
jgi:peptidyl-prolyl cis-trans isomerase A (cyclophilin A)